MDNSAGVKSTRTLNKPRKKSSKQKKTSEIKGSVETRRRETAHKEPTAQRASKKIQDGKGNELEKLTDKKEGVHNRRKESAGQKPPTVQKAIKKIQNDKNNEHQVPKSTKESGKRCRSAKPGPLQRRNAVSLSPEDPTTSPTRQPPASQNIQDDKSNEQRKATAPKSIKETGKRCRTVKPPTIRILEDGIDENREARWPIVKENAMFLSPEEPCTSPARQPPVTPEYCSSRKYHVRERKMEFFAKRDEPVQERKERRDAVCSDTDNTSEERIVLRVVRKKF